MTPRTAPERHGVRLVPSFVGKPFASLGAAAKNAVEVARLGGLETGEQPTPFTVVARDPMYRLRHYAADSGPADRPDDAGPPMLLVPPLMLTAEVYDVSPQSSAVRVLQAAGVDPWVIDFGSPEREVGGTERTLADHVLAVSARGRPDPRRRPASDVILAGYSQGGMFCYQAAAYRRSEGIAGLVTFGSPVDLRGALPLGLPESDRHPRRQPSRSTCSPGAPSRPGSPATPSRCSTRCTCCGSGSTSSVSCTTARRCCPREGQRRFLMGQGWVAWPGPGGRRVRPAVPRPQPDARGRLHDRRSHRDARRHRRADPLLRRRRGRHRARARGPRDPAGGAARARSTRCRCRPGTSGSSSGAPPACAPGRWSACGRTGSPATSASCRTSPATSTRPARWSRRAGTRRASALETPCRSASATRWARRSTPRGRSPAPRCIR